MDSTTILHQHIPDSLENILRHRPATSATFMRWRDLHGVFDVLKRYNSPWNLHQRLLLIRTDSPRFEILGHVPQVSLGPEGVTLRSQKNSSLSCNVKCSRAFATVNLLCSLQVKRAVLLQRMCTQQAASCSTFSSAGICWQEISCRMFVP